MELLIGLLLLGIAGVINTKQTVDKKVQQIQRPMDESVYCIEWEFVLGFEIYKKIKDEILTSPEYMDIKSNPSKYDDEYESLNDLERERCEGHLLDGYALVEAQNKIMSMGFSPAKYMFGGVNYLSSRFDPYNAANSPINLSRWYVYPPGIGNDVLIPHFEEGRDWYHNMDLNRNRCWVVKEEEIKARRKDIDAYILEKGVKNFYPEKWDYLKRKPSIYSNTEYRTKDAWFYEQVEKQKKLKEALNEQNETGNDQKSGKQS